MCAVIDGGFKIIKVIYSTEGNCKIMFIICILITIIQNQKIKHKEFVIGL